MSLAMSLFLKRKVLLTTLQSLGIVKFSPCQRLSNVVSLNSSASLRKNISNDDFHQALHTKEYFDDENGVDMLRFLIKDKTIPINQKKIYFETIKNKMKTITSSVLAIESFFIENVSKEKDNMQQDKLTNYDLKTSFSLISPMHQGRNCDVGEDVDMLLEEEVCQLLMNNFTSLAKLKLQQCLNSRKGTGILISFIEECTKHNVLAKGMELILDLQLNVNPIVTLRVSEVIASKFYDIGRLDAAKQTLSEANDKLGLSPISEIFHWEDTSVEKCCFFLENHSMIENMNGHYIMKLIDCTLQKCENEADINLLECSANKYGILTIKNKDSFKFTHFQHPIYNKLLNCRHDFHQTAHVLTKELGPIYSIFLFWVLREFATLDIIRFIIDHAQYKLRKGRRIYFTSHLYCLLADYTGNIDELISKFAEGSFPVTKEVVTQMLVLLIQFTKVPSHDIVKFMEMEYFEYKHVEFLCTHFDYNLPYNFLFEFKKSKTLAYRTVVDSLRDIDMPLKYIDMI